MQLEDRVGRYRKKGNNNMIDDYRVNPIGQRNHPRITLTTDSSDRLYRSDYPKERQRYFRNTRIPWSFPELRVNFIASTLAISCIIFFFYRDATTRASHTYTAFYTPTRFFYLIIYVYEFSIDERCKCWIYHIYAHLRLMITLRCLKTRTANTNIFPYVEKCDGKFL